MFIHEVVIKGFRGINNGKIKFSENSVLIGANNCGKTTIIEALALLLGRERMVRNLSEHDFWGSTPEVTDRIRIVVTLAGFSSNDPGNHNDWFRPSRGVPVWLRKSDNETISSPETEQDRLACRIALDARFDYQSLEVESVRYFFDDTNTGDPFDEYKGTEGNAAYLRKNSEI